MIVFITGGEKNGKSTLAQKVALKLADGGKRYYVATMIPTDKEDLRRIELHVEDRDGQGFETLEQGRDLCDCLEKADVSGTFLLDSTTALLMNELFDVQNDFALDENAPKRCLNQVEEFVKSVKNAVVVSDYIYSDGAFYDEVTETYRKGLADIDRMLVACADTVVEMSAGNMIVHKGELLL